MTGAVYESATQEHDARAEASADNRTQVMRLHTHRMRRVGRPTVVSGGESYPL